MNKVILLKSYIPAVSDEAQTAAITEQLALFEALDVQAAPSSVIAAAGDLQDHTLK